MWHRLQTIYIHTYRNFVLRGTVFCATWNCSPPTQNHRPMEQHAGPAKRTFYTPQQGRRDGSCQQQPSDAREQTDARRNGLRCTCDKPCPCRRQRSTGGRWSKPIRQHQAREYQPYFTMLQSLEQWCESFDKRRGGTAPQRSASKRWKDAVDSATFSTRQHFILQSYSYAVQMLLSVYLLIWIYVWQKNHNRKKEKTLDTI